MDKNKNINKDTPEVRNGNKSKKNKSKKSKHVKNKNKNTKKKSMLPVIILVLIGVLVICYPFIASIVNGIKYKMVSSQFDKQIENYSINEIRDRIELQRDFNDYLQNPNSDIPATQKRYKKGIAEYKRLYDTLESIGYINIPKIDQKIPIYVGESDLILQRGVGLMQNTSFPIGGRGTHSVLTGHSGLPTAKLFTDIKKLKIGDEFFIHNIKEVLAYRVDKIQVVLPTNFGPLAIDKDKDYCTLLTCTPYMINTHRLLVRGVRVPYNKQMEKTNSNPIIKILLILLIILILILLWYLWRRRKKNKEKGKNLIEKQ